MKVLKVIGIVAGIALALGLIVYFFFGNKTVTNENGITVSYKTLAQKLKYTGNDGTSVFILTLYSDNGNGTYNYYDANKKLIAIDTIPGILTRTTPA